VYDEALERPAPPWFWIALSAVLGACCFVFFLSSLLETYWLLNGYTLVVPASPSDKPGIGEIKFYTEQTSSGGPSGAAITRLSSGAKTIYAYFDYKNMPRTPVNWSYLWTLDGADLPGASKSDQRWTRDGSGVYFLKLNDDKGLKAGVYELIVDIGNEEQSASFVVGP
jgi:hypothetical protein